MKCSALLLPMSPVHSVTHVSGPDPEIYGPAWT